MLVVGRPHKSTPGVGGGRLGLGTSWRRWSGWGGFVVWLGVGCWTAIASPASGPKGRSRGSGLACQNAVLVDDGEGAVQALLELHAATGVGTASWSGRYLDQAFLQPHSVVVGDAAEVVEAADSPEACALGQRPVRGLRFCRPAGEALAEAGQVGLERGVGLFQSTGVRPPAVLPQAGLRRVPPQGS